MLFFAFSGYLIYRPFVMGDVDLRRYAVHRLRRIVPAYLLALVGVTLLTGDRTFLEQPLTYLLFLQNYDLALWQGFLGVSWTLVLEVLFYLTLPVIAILIARSPRASRSSPPRPPSVPSPIFLFVPRVHPIRLRAACSRRCSGRSPPGCWSPSSRAGSAGPLDR